MVEHNTRAPEDETFVLKRMDEDFFDED